jgi:homogentisate 1,2-dioxygenase
MPSYVRAGELPSKRHIQFRRPDGGLYAEELFSTKGFEGVYSLLYHARPPTATLEVRAWGRAPVRLIPNEPLRNRHFRTAESTRTGDVVDARAPVLANPDISIEIADVDTRMEYFYRNAGGDELLFVHRGSGTLETPFGDIDYGPRDYLVIPTGTTYRLQPSSPTRLVVFASRGAVEVPRFFRNAYGQLTEGAPYYERDFRAPQLRDPVDAPGEYEVRVTNAGRDAIYTVQHHPFDVVGWDGYCYPYAFNLDEYAPITGKLHQPPPAHSTFVAPGAAFCAFVPRLFDYHPLAIPVPYNHSSVDCDEVIYYVSGNFMSRRGIEEGSITLHAAGAPHGPQPGAVEASLGKASTDEVAIMVDTFKPLSLAEDALALEDADYHKSWIERSPVGT